VKVIFLSIILAGIIYSQDSTVTQALNRYNIELNNAIDRLQFKVDSLEMRCRYLESLLYPALYTVDGRRLYTIDGNKIYAKKE